MARGLLRRRGTSGRSGGSFLLCCYNLAKSPLFIGCFLITAIVISNHFLFPGGEDLLLNSSAQHYHNDNITIPSNVQVSEPQVNIDASSSIGLPSNANEHQQEQHHHGLSIQSSTIQHLQGLSDFPKVVHLIWNDKNILNTTYQMLEHGAKNLQRLNPDSTFKVHDFEEIDYTIQQFTDHPDIMDKSMQNDLLNAHIVERTDAFRLITIYQTGGIYVDVDRVMGCGPSTRPADCPINLNKIINTQITKLVIPTYYDINFAQDLFGSSPGNNLILNIFKRQCDKRKKYPRQNGWIKSSDHMTIVNTYSESLEIDLFGKRLLPPSPNEKESMWNEARHVLNVHSGGAIVTKKDEWCNGLLVIDYDGCKSVSREPLYEAYNVTPWVKQVDAVWAKKKEEEEKKYK